MLDGAARLPALMQEAERLAMPAVAMTDHGNMFGAFAFYQAARRAGITPILGIEAYLAPSSRFHKKALFWGGPGERANDVAGAGAYTHMTLFAEDPTGLRNLFRLSSLASIEGFHRKPRMDRELLARYSEGIIATTGCPSGEVQTRLRLGQQHEALQAAADYRDIFGPGNFFLELMDHGLAIEKTVRDDLLRLGKQLGLPPLATNDSHYVTRDQAGAHAALLCVQSGTTLHDPNRFQFDGDGYYLKSADEMRTLFDGVPGACDNTLLIAERIQPYDEVFAFVNRMPLFPVPEGETQQSWLVKETWKGLHQRFPDGVPEEYRKRTEYELGIIDQMGFPAYFLIVADLTSFARREKIRIAPGRGSATGCLVAYALGITDLDPIEHRLIFERFLNPERVSMPDIDLDIDSRYRDAMIRYITQRWGDDRVCQILTLGTIKAKAALKDAARVLGHPYSMGDRLTKAMPPPVGGVDISLSGVLDPTHPRYPEAAELRTLVQQDPTAEEIFTTALGLEGLIRQPGVHAAGVIVSSQPLLDVLPIWRRDDGAIISGFTFPEGEEIGLLKIDFLGLRNLDVVDDAVRNVQRNQDPDFELNSRNLEDPTTYTMMARGDTLGVFQLDSAPMRALLRLMAPTRFEDIAAVLALYRPGPMAANAHIDYADRKNNRKPAVPIHPEFEHTLADILDPTYGLIVYQEQVLAIAQRVAGYSLGKADMLRRAMGKKKKEILDKEFVSFAEGMRTNGYSDNAIATLWEILLPFAGYAFNRSHTAGYGVISFWTAYLKANYPVEFMAALLTSVGEDKTKMGVYLAECRRMGITVLPPDVNDSAAEFTPIGAQIRFGLGAIRNVGANAVAAILRARETHGAYTSFWDFLQKAELVVCNKQLIESLIKAGAFDSLGHPRKGLLHCHAAAVDAVTSGKRREERGQYDLFTDEPEVASTPIVGADLTIPDQEWAPRDLLAFEREMLGLYVSGHPLAGAENVLRRAGEHSIAAILDGDIPDGAPVVIAGMIARLERRVTKDGRAWATTTVEDLDSGIEVNFFPRTYELLQPGQLAADLVVAIRGRVNRREQGINIAASDIRLLDVDTAASPAPVTVVVDLATFRPEMATRLADIARAHPGSAPLRIKLRRPGRDTLLSATVAVNPDSPAFRSEIKELLGAGGIQ
jgi:DNA polymerase-3 subunit alpha